MNDQTTAPRTTMNGKPVLTVPVKTILNLHSGFEEKLLCDGPTFALGEGCAYSCSFCYVPAIYQKLGRVREALAGAGKEHHEVVMLRADALEILKGQLLHPNGDKRFDDPTDRRVVYSSPADDVAANMDLVRATAEACKLILTTTWWQIRILSKSNLLPRLAAGLVEWAESDEKPMGHRGAERIRERMIFGVSTGTLDDNIARVFEQGAPIVSKRIESLHVLQDNHFRTFAMVCPSLPMATPADYMDFARRASVFLRYERCEHVWAEVINLRGESFTRTRDALLAGGFERLARELDLVSHDAEHWEKYNRATFLAHAEVCKAWVGKLRFLTYVKPHTRAWWQGQIAHGAVLLGQATQVNPARDNKPAPQPGRTFA